MKRLLGLLLLLAVAMPAHAFVWSSAVERALEQMLDGSGRIIRITITAGANITPLTVTAFSTQSNTSPLALFKTSAGVELLRIHSDHPNNLFLGNRAGELNNVAGGAIEGLFSTFVGALAGRSNTTGGENTAVGYSALGDNTTGDYNIAVGTSSMLTNTTGRENTAVGYSTFRFNTTGKQGVALGFNALRNNTTGDGNIALGYSALTNNTSANNSIAIGYQALLTSSTGTGNIGIGTNTLYANTTGGNNVGLGYTALRFNTTASYNSGIGFQSLYSNTTGTGNAGLSTNSLYSNTTGSYNTAIGYASGYTATPANANVSGNYNTYIGYNSGPSAATQFNYSTAIGAYALVGANNAIVLGGTGAAVANVGISLPVPTARLHLPAGTTVAGSAPLKIASGPLLTTAEAGVIEFLTDAYYGTITTGAARKTFAFLESPIFTGTTTTSALTMGIPRFNGTNTTAVVAGLIGTTCPAATCSVAYTWIQAVAADGSTVYFPVWK